MLNCKTRSNLDQRCTCCATHGTHAFRKAVPSLSMTYGRNGELQHNTHHKRLSAAIKSTASHHPCCQKTTDLSAPMATVADPKGLFKKETHVSVSPHLFSCNLTLLFAHHSSWLCTPATLSGSHDNNSRQTQSAQVHHENRHPGVKLPMCDHVGGMKADVIKMSRLQKKNRFFQKKIQHKIRIM